jgi:hypothetical protein
VNENRQPLIDERQGLPELHSESRRRQVGALTIPGFAAPTVAATLKAVTSRMQKANRARISQQTARLQRDLVHTIDAYKKRRSLSWKLLSRHSPFLEKNLFPVRRGRCGHTPPARLNNTQGKTKRWGAGRWIRLAPLRATQTQHPLA